MAIFLIFADTTEARRFETNARVLLGLPALARSLPGYIESPGPHAADAADITGAVAPGWAVRHELYVRHPSDGRIAVRVTGAMQTAWDDNKDRLTPAERAWVQAQLETGADLAAEWLSDGALLEDLEVNP
ncbi:MAG: hypothetical protein FJ027_24315 [Candidatus Rokubacteria bacterium]|nr:hypothetical protein [Candidatus Rokubacteria bacterium]